MNKNNFVTYKLFGQFKNLLAFTTTKKSIPVTVPRFTSDSEKVFANNRKLLAGALGVGQNQLIFPRQTHTNNVVEVLKIPETEIENCDALITNRPGICICVQTADCVPILLFDPVNKVIAAIHAGWRGTVKKIVAVAIAKMVVGYNSSPGNILATVGTSIGPDVYEVGYEVVNAVQKTIPNSEKTLHRNNAGKYHFDLWEANRQILLESGVRSGNIEITGECSFAKSDKYFSARRDGIETGRMVTGIMLNL
jgi:YfiH family protein